MIVRGWTRVGSQKRAVHQKWSPPPAVAYTQSGVHHEAWLSHHDLSHMKDAGLDHARLLGFYFLIQATLYAAVAATSTESAHEITCELSWTSAAQSDPIAFDAGTVSRLSDSSAPSCASAAQQKPARGREAFFPLAVAAGRAAPTPHPHADRSAGRQGCDRVEAARMPARTATEVSHRVKEKQARTREEGMGR